MLITHLPSSTNQKSMPCRALDRVASSVRRIANSSEGLRYAAEIVRRICGLIFLAKPKWPLTQVSSTISSISVVFGTTQSIIYTLDWLEGRSVKSNWAQHVSQVFYSGFSALTTVQTLRDFKIIDLAQISQQMGHVRVVCAAIHTVNLPYAGSVLQLFQEGFAAIGSGIQLYQNRKGREKLRGLDKPMQEKNLEIERKKIIVSLICQIARVVFACASIGMFFVGASPFVCSAVLLLLGIFSFSSSLFNFVYGKFHPQIDASRVPT